MRKAFTLVELLIVVAIIAILAAVAVPQFTKYKRNAAASAAAGAITSCMSELAAAYADNSSNTTLTCHIPKSSDNVTLKIDPATGNIDFNGNNSTSIKVSGINVNCTIDNNAVTCKP